MPAQNSNDELDEYAASNVTSARLNTDHNHIHMNNEDCIPVLERCAANGFDGMFDPGVAPFEMLAWQVHRDKTKVMLISDGPDEFMGGYSVDRRAWQIDQIRKNSSARYGLMRLLSANRLGRGVLRRLRRRDLLIPPDVSYKPFHFEPQHQGASPDYLRRILSASQIRATADDFGVIDPAYSDILPELDYSQHRALSYATNSLPDMFNLRTDKAFMRASVECRLPFQAPEMAEFQIALPAAMRFSEGGTTKFLLRKIIERRIGTEVAHRSKHGFSMPLYATPSVRAALPFMETIAASSMFDDLPFTPGARDIVLNPRFTKFKWPFYTLARTYEQLRTGKYDLGAPSRANQTAL
jgi:asparagine synthetase B (glutamine-hydrolysing)